MNELFWIILIVIFLLIHLGIWILIFNKLRSKPPLSEIKDAQAVSIIICARTAKDHLERNLPYFLNQNYSEFELILIDDDSQDGTEHWARNIQQNYPRLKYFRNHKTLAGKKQALALGVSKASHQWIALTDADCRPATSVWLKTMMFNVVDSTKIVLAYAPFSKKPGWLNSLIRMEACLNAIQYLSVANLGFPYMGTGRNLLYHKSIFDLQALKLDIAYGDDDLLISSKSTSTNTVVCTDPNSFVFSNPEDTYENYFKQKWRHYAASHHYKWFIKVYLFVYFASLLGFYISFVVLMLLKFYIIAASCLCIKFLLTWPVFCKQCRMLKEQDLCKYFPILTLVYVVHIFVQIPFLWIKKKSW